MKPSFSDANMIDWLDSNTEESYDTLTFGVVQMNGQGIVTAYNTYLSVIGGISKENAIGKQFFSQVAPCTNNFMVAEKYRQESLDEELPYIFTYVTQPTPVILRLIKGKKGTQYLLAKKA
jgi:photoactive yellow protein